MKRAFISFDFEHDEDLRVLLVGQAKHSDTPFEFADWSVKQAMTGNWKEKVRARLRQTDLVMVICGEWTHTASGVDVEMAIAREERKPYFLLAGRADKRCTRPTGAAPQDQMYEWTWNNLKLLVGGNR